MTTVISPSNGEGVLYTQQGAGTTPGYAALDDRRMGSGALQEGVYGTATTVSAGGVSSVAAADFMVTQRASGANMSVDINMPAGGFAWVQGDTINGQGLYGVPVASANVNEVLAAADTSNPRVDSVILEVQDNVLDASGGNLSQTRVLTGAATSGATLTNRTGAVTLPGNALLLADVLVAANATSVANSAIRDRRKWARGASVRLVKTSGSPTNSTTTHTPIDATNLNARVECSGAPLRVSLLAIGANGTSGDGIITGCWMDSTIFGYPILGQLIATVAGSCGYDFPATATAGSHVFEPAFAAAVGGTATLFTSTNAPAVFAVREDIRAVSPNNVVTSG